MKKITLNSFIAEAISYDWELEKFEFLGKEIVAWLIQGDFVITFVTNNFTENTKITVELNDEVVISIPAKYLTFSVDSININFEPEEDF